VHDVPVRSHPIVRGDLDAEMGDALGRHEPAPGDAPCEARLLGAKGEMAHAGMDAVRTDHKVDLDRSAILESRDRPLAVLFQVDQFVTDM